MLGRPCRRRGSHSPEWTDKCARATASRPMGPVKEASWSTPKLCHGMTGKAMEIADVLRRRKVDIACIGPTLEVKWKGSKARNMGHGYKLFYHG